MSFGKKYFSLLILVALSSSAFGQAANSPFSTFGIGEPYGNALIHNQGMGGIGVSQPQFWFINNQNPALLVYNYQTTFQAGVVGENRKITSDTISQQGFNGNLNYLVTAFPLKRGKWTNAIGLMPFTSVNYKIFYEDQVRDNNDVVVDTVFVREQGSGGLSQLYWAHGIRLHPDWSVGLKATYIFSSIDTDYSNQLANPNQQTTFIVGINEQTYVRDFQFTTGLSYSKDSLLNGDYRLSAGLVYSFGSNLRAERTSVIERRNTSGNPITSDTLVTQRGTLYLPPSFALGASFSNGQKWSVGVEYSTQDWSKFKSLNSEDEDGLDKAWKVALGGEYTPDQLAFDKFFKRITYRAGVSFENYPFSIENPDNPNKFNQVKDFGINFGLSIPAGRSSLDMAFRVGKRGNQSETILEETYWKIYFGITFNDQWFIRRKFD
jgi:hypothetical protein